MRPAAVANSTLVNFGLAVEAVGFFPRLPFGDEPMAGDMDGDATVRVLDAVLVAHLGTPVSCQGGVGGCHCRGWVERDSSINWASSFDTCSSN